MPTPAMRATSNGSEIFTDWKWSGTWHEFVGKVKRVWGDLTGDSLLQYEGNYEEALGYIQRKTGETFKDIQRKIMS